MYTMCNKKTTLLGAFDGTTHLHHIGPIFPTNRSGPKDI